MRFLYLLFLLLAFIGSCFNRPARLENQPNPSYKQAIQFRDAGRLDSAFLYFNRAKDLFLQRQDRFQAGKCLINMAIISTEVGDNFGGQELSLNAIPYLNNNDPDHHIYIKSNLNNLGITSYKLKKFSQAINFYQQSLAYTGDSTAILAVKNNIALAYRGEKNYQAALDVYQDLLQRERDSVNFAKALASYAYTRWLQDSNYNPVTEFSRALAIRKRKNDILGQNASYAYLTDYYMQKRPQAALHYATEMYKLATLLKSPDDQLFALQKLVKLSPPESTKTYFDLYQQLDDSLQTVRNAAKNQFALIRYEAEKHKADNLKLQQEKTARNVWIVSLLLLLTGGSVFIIFWYKRRKERLELESQHTIQEAKLKTSRKVHDVVANGLYRIMSEIENGDNLDQDKILNNMETLYERSRDISYESDEQSIILQAFENEVNETLHAFETNRTKVVILGNTARFWEKVGQQEKLELKHVLQELMVNMSKHSGASHVAIRFEDAGESLRIHYTDNGKGMPEGTNFGNGLHNTGNRINSIKGSISFGQSSEGGLKILISFPAAKQ